MLRTLPAVGQPDYCVSQGHARSLYLGYFKMFFCFDSVRRFRGARMIASGFGNVFYIFFCARSMKKRSCLLVEQAENSGVIRRVLSCLCS